jgi:hypothetical protein
MPRPQPEIADSISRIVGAEACGFRRVLGGYTPAERWVFQCARGTFFAKVGVTPLTALLLRREAVAYSVLAGPFLPALIGWQDHATAPVLVLEDLSAAVWPPPWTSGRVEALKAALAELHACHAALPRYREIHGERGENWLAVARDPQPLLSLGLTSARWLQACLPTLVDAESRCPTEGDQPTHWDIRSDNVCFRDGRAVLVDWAEACLANPDLDTGFWLPSLAYEAGLLPEVILPGRGDVAAWVSGFFAARAGLPTIPDAPGVRVVQRLQLETALAWAIRALKLAPLDIAPGRSPGPAPGGGPQSPAG